MMTPITAHDGMAGRAADNHDSTMPEARFGRVMIAVGLAVECGFIADEHGLIAAAQPETVAAVVRLVTDVGVARTPGFNAVVVSVGRVVFDKHISTRHPAVEDANEDAVAALGDVVAEPIVLIRAALDQHAGRVPRVHFAFGPVDPQPVRKIVVQELVAGGRRQLRADIRAVREVVSRDTGE